MLAAEHMKIVIFWPMTFSRTKPIVEKKHAGRPRKSFFLLAYAFSSTHETVVAFQNFLGAVTFSLPAGLSAALYR